MSTGEIYKNYDNSEFLDEFFQYYDKAENVCAHGGKIFTLENIDKADIHFGNSKGNEKLGILFWWNYNEEGNWLSNDLVGLVEENIIVEKNIEEKGNIDDMVNQAVSFAQKGDFSNALKYSKWAFKADTTIIENRNLMSMYYIFNKKYDKAVQNLEIALKECEPTNSELKLQIERNLSHAYLLKNEYNKAITIHKNNINKNIDNEMWLSVIYKDLERLEHNNISSDNFSKIKSDMLDYEYNIVVKNADDFLQVDSLEKAKQNYERASELKPDETYPKNQLNIVKGKIIDKTYSDLIKNADLDFQNKK